jgi:hypothetical protein
MLTWHGASRNKVLCATTHESNDYSKSTNTYELDNKLAIKLVDPTLSFLIQVSNLENPIPIALCFAHLLSLPNFVCKDNQKVITIGWLWQVSCHNIQWIFGHSIMKIKGKGNYRTSQKGQEKCKRRKDGKMSSRSD